MSGKKDFLSECMDSLPKSLALDEFQAAYCSVCINPDCHRSRWADSRWLTRMAMQEQALNNPIFGDPNDPRFADIITTHFEPVDEDTLDYYGGWVEVREDGSVVRYAEPPTEETSADKLDTALESLKKGADPDPVGDVPEDKDDEDPDPEDNSEEGSETEDSSPKPKPLKTRNTPAPKGGIILKPNLKIEKPQSALLHKPRDPWAVPKSSSKRGKNGKLVVRASDGKVLKGDSDEG